MVWMWRHSDVDAVVYPLIIISQKKFRSKIRMKQIIISYKFLK